MGQFGLFDAVKRLAALSAKGDPLEAIDRLVPWESFRADIEAVVLTPDEMRKSSAGRKPAVHDSQKLDGLLNKGNTSAEVFADSAYRSTKIEAQLRASGFKSRIHQRAARNHPLSDAQGKSKPQSL